VVDFLSNPPLSPFFKGGSQELNLMAVTPRKELLELRACLEQQRYVDALILQKLIR
jgi:hypothetical protein